MEEIKNAELDAEALEVVAGGQTSNPDAANWQAVNAEMGTAFLYRNMLWYRLKLGDSLWKVSQQFGTTVADLRAWNPATTDPSQVLQAGAALVVKKYPNQWDFAHYPHYQF